MNIIVKFNFGDDDFHEIECEIVTGGSIDINNMSETERNGGVEKAVQQWVTDNVSYEWEENYLADNFD